LSEWRRGLTLYTEDGNAWIEIGGLPEEDE
jgi:hypothetical protein